MYARYVCLFHPLVHREFTHKHTHIHPTQQTYSTRTIYTSRPTIAKARTDTAGPSVCRPYIISVRAHRRFVARERRHLAMVWWTSQVPTDAAGRRRVKLRRTDDDDNDNDDVDKRHGYTTITTTIYSAPNCRVRRRRQRRRSKA